MTFDHPLRGTCTRGCPMFSRCHCGCGEQTSIAPKTSTSMGRRQGFPMVFVLGHALRVNPLQGGPAYSRQGIPVERIQPLVGWLGEIYGSFTQVAALLGCDRTWLCHLRSGRVKRVSPRTAERITRVVLIHRKKRDPFSTFEEDGIRRLPTQQEVTYTNNLEATNKRVQNAARRREMRASA